MGKEALIKSTIASSLGWDENDEKPVDRLTAIGMAHNPLGSLILRAYGDDRDAYFEAYCIVGRLVRVRADKVRISANRAASAVLADIIDQRCHTCQGRGQIRNKESVHICPTCNGSALRDTRIIRRKVGGKDIPDGLYSEIFRIYADAVVNLIRATNQMLE